jgi:hypothetical protein
MEEQCRFDSLLLLMIGDAGTKTQIHQQQRAADAVSGPGESIVTYTIMRNLSLNRKSSVSAFFGFSRARNA